MLPTVYFNGHNSIQDNSITLKFRTSTIQRFNNGDPNNFDDYTHENVRQALVGLSQPTLIGLHRWFESATQTIAGEITEDIINLG